MTAVPALLSPALVTGRGTEPADLKAGFAAMAERASAANVGAAELCHDLALLLDRLGDAGEAEAFHRRAGMLLVEMPTGTPVDRHRIGWARSLASNLIAQDRLDEATDVLQAAIALAEALLGADDIDTVETALLLDDLRERRKVWHRRA